MGFLARKICKANPLGGKNGTVEALSARWNPTTLIKRIRTVHSLADRIDLHCEDAAQFIEDWFWDSSATLFVDPPYFSQGKALYNLFFTQEQHERLAWTLQSIHHGYPSADVIVTYDYHTEIEAMYFGADEQRIIGRNYCI